MPDLLQDRDRLQTDLRRYYRLITGVDIAIGQIREALAERRLQRDTVILFTSDNGLLLGEHGLWGKWLMYEESIRVPMILYDPRLPASQRGSDRNQMVLNIDVATLLELAGVPVPERMQGKSMVPVLTRPEHELRDVWFYEHHFELPGRLRLEPSEGVRTLHFKYIRYIAQEELYDLTVDPGETLNLAMHPDYQDALGELRHRYAQLHEECGNAS